MAVHFRPRRLGLLTGLLLLTFGDEARASTVGPDAFGMTAHSATYTFDDIRASGTLALSGCDDCAKGVSLGFNFSFYGKTYSSVSLTSNGYLSFGSTGLTDFAPDRLPNTASPNAVIAGFWADLDLRPAGASVRWRQQGSAPSRQFVAQWTDVCHYNQDCSGRSTFQIVLHEQGAIDIRLARVDSDGRTHSTGVENAGGTVGLSIAYGTFAFTEQAWRVSAGPADSDGDGVNDTADNCPSVANANQANHDGDANGDACDPDDDNDAVADASDNCPRLANTNQANHDGDANGDACDPDDDNDFYADVSDCAPLDASIHPGAQELPYSSQDENCNGLDDDTIEGAVAIVSEVSSGVDAGDLQNRNHAKAWQNKLEAVTQTVNEGLRTGDPEHFQEALDKLESDLLAKADGCAREGEPDANDWYLSCAAQAGVYAALLDLMSWISLLL
jgi:hypothetical protein